MLDCVILGAGPAGLTALTYLARFHRKAVALASPAAPPRVRLIDRSFNLPGFKDGLSGDELLENLRHQAEAVGGEVKEAQALRVEGSDDAFTVHLKDGAPLKARKIILAMGVRDREPDVPGIQDYVGDFVRYCPICDGYEHTGKQLGIIGSGVTVARHALFLRAFSNRISVFLHGEAPESLDEYASILKQKEIEVYPARITGIIDGQHRDEEVESPHRGCGVCLEDGSEHQLSVLYSALGCEVNLQPVQDLDLKVDEQGYLTTDLSQATSVKGIYAAGDAASQLNQISIAFGQAAVAAINAHNSLDEIA